MPDGKIFRTPAQCPSNVRVALPQDAPALFAFLIKDYGPTVADLPVDRERVYSYVENCCLGAGGIAGIIEEDGEIVASTGIVLDRVWFSAEWFLSQAWVAVRQDRRRGTGYYDDLRKFADWHHADMEARTGTPFKLSLSVYSSDRLPEKTRLWARRAKPVGVVFWSEERV